ncbi:hypothetical protein ACUXG3_005664 [Bacillus thuringiensis]
MKELQLKQQNVVHSISSININSLYSITPKNGESFRFSMNFSNIPQHILPYRTKNITGSPIILSVWNGGASNIEWYAHAYSPNGGTGPWVKFRHGDVSFTLPNTISAGSLAIVEFRTSGSMQTTVFWDLGTTLI